MAQDRSILVDYTEYMKDFRNKIAHIPEDPIVTPKKFWEQVKELEESGQYTRDELGEIRATLLVNYGPEGRLRPGLIVDTSASTLSMMLHVLKTLENKIIDFTHPDFMEQKIRIYDVRTNGLPDDNPELKGQSLTGRVAFIFDGCIVSGWPLVYNKDNGLDKTYADKEGFACWEANSDVGRINVRFEGVRKYIVFEKPIYEYEHESTGNTGGDAQG